MKNILLAVVGLSPQVITETLFALHQQGRKTDEIHVITTRRGKEQINAHLLSRKDGMYYSYLRDYGIDPHSINFGFDHIHTVRDDRDIEIDDIASEEENEWLLKLCLVKTFRLTQDPNNAVFFSIAGGRKTMSACLMVAAQFYGRPQDRIFHVLVTPEFESSRNFFYPPKTSTSITLQDRNDQAYIKETKYAAVNLAPIPFISVREHLSDAMLRSPKDPATLLLSLIREDPYYLVLDLTASRLVYKKVQFDMMPARLALFAFFAQQKKNCGKERPACRGCTDCYLDFQEISAAQDRIAALYRRIAGSRDVFEMSDSGIIKLEVQNFNSYKTKIRKDLEKGFGLQALPELKIESVGKKPDTRYGIRIDREKIRLIF
jgi:CRISPR-associated protein Csx14